MSSTISSQCSRTVRTRPSLQNGSSVRNVVSARAQPHRNIADNSPARLSFRSATRVTGSQRLQAIKPRQAVRSHATTISAAETRDTLEALISKTDLSMEETEAALSKLLAEGDPAEISAFLVLLRAKGETADEVAGLASAMIKEAVTVDCGGDVLDIVGTGGDGIGSVNISTGSCLIAAAAGARVAKHGNRSVSSMCGSADVLEELGVAVDLGPEAIAECVNTVGMAFMYAPRYHPAMKAVVPVRKALRVRTAFNILGPMLNPASAETALVGVYSSEAIPLMGEALLRLGMKRALVVHSLGLDELTPMGPADVMEVTPEGTKRYEFDPLEVGIERCSVEDLKGGDKAMNAKLLRESLGGAVGPIGDALALNAGVALWAAGVKGADTPKDGVKMALEVQKSGKALEVLDAWCALSQELSAKEKAAA